jgi:hypothetical protein
MDAQQSESALNFPARDIDELRQEIARRVLTFAEEKVSHKEIVDAVLKSFGIEH